MGRVVTVGQGSGYTDSSSCPRSLLCWGNSFPSYLKLYFSQSKWPAAPGCSEVTSWLLGLHKINSAHRAQTRSYPSLPQSLPKVAHHSENQISSSSCFHSNLTSKHSEGQGVSAIPAALPPGGPMTCKFWQRVALFAQAQSSHLILFKTEIWDYEPRKGKAWPQDMEWGYFLGEKFLNLGISKE